MKLAQSSLYINLFVETRARVYLLWLVLATAGFAITHFWQMRTINILWFIISFIGLGYMFVVMPLRVKQMQKILWSWVVPVCAGMVFSAAIFQVNALAQYVAYLGTIWLVIMAVGYIWNGLVDKPFFWYGFAGVVNLLAAFGTYYYQPFIEYQYIVAAVISFWSMANLWLFRT